MIIRKPYAFLIQNFKKIHFFLSFLMIYLLYRSNNILSFFNEYISTRTYAYTGNLAGSYINIYLYIAIISIVIFSLIIYILMRQKNKPKLLYLSIIAFYLVLSFFFFQIYNYLVALEINPLDPQVVRVIRDVILIATLIQFFLVTFIVVRSFGFNIKKFKFGEDLQNLKIDVSDSEEVELTVGIDSSNIGRKLRRQKRELKYFFVEHFFIFSILITALMIVVVIFLYLHFNVYNIIYEEQTYFKVNDFVVNVNESYFTTIDYKGENIAPENKIYLIVNFNVENKAYSNRNINLKNLRMFTKNKKYEPITGRYQSFFDLGRGYNNQTISAGENRDFIVIFEIEETEKRDDIIFSWTESLYFSLTSLQAEYKKVRLKPFSLDEKERVAAKKIPEIISINSFIETVTFNINNYEIGDKINYMSLMCVQSICEEVQRIIIIAPETSQNKTLLKINYQIHNSNIKDFPLFVNTFAKIRYNIEGKNYQTTIKNITPSDIIGNELFIEVSRDLIRAEKIEFLFNLRNKEYIYRLK